MIEIMIRPLHCLRAFVATALLMLIILSACACEKKTDSPSSAPAKPVAANKPEAPAPELWPAVIIRNDKGEDWLVRVELARTNEERRRGLMERGSLEPDTGMLFIFPDVRTRSFWMKDTWVPLDMIFIGVDRRIVGIIENAEPNTETTRTVGKPSKWVLEVSGGACAFHGVKAGDRVYFYIDAGLKE